MSELCEQLHAEFVALREERRAGNPHLIYRERLAYGRWFRQAVEEGRSPDSLVTVTLCDVEQLRAGTIQGAEHTYWKGPHSIRLKDGGIRKVEIFVMELSLGRKVSDYHEVVERACEAHGCIRPSHLRIREKRRRTMSQAEAIQMLRAAARRLGRPPIGDEIGSGAPHSATVRKLFGSWAGGLDAAGLEAREPAVYSNDDILQALTSKAQELGRVPLASEWEYGLWSPSYATISRRWRGRGGFNAALVEAGISEKVAA